MNPHGNRLFQLFSVCVVTGCRRCMIYDKPTGEKRTMANIQPPTAVPGSFYRCAFEECGMAYEQENSFRIHNLVKHSDEYSYPCHYCASAFSDEEQLISHIVAHKSKAPTVIYRCVIDKCTFSSNVPVEFRNHNQRQHLDADSFPCCHCIEAYTSAESLLEHLQTHVQKYCLCPYCSTKSKQRSDIVQHIALEHKDEPRRVIIHTEIVGCNTAPPVEADAAPSDPVVTPVEEAIVTNGDSPEEAVPISEPDPVPRHESPPIPSPASTGGKAPHGASKRKSKPVKRVVVQETDGEAEEGEITNTALLKPQSAIKEVKCEKCGFISPAEQAAKVHEEMHNATTTQTNMAYKCPECPYRCADKKIILGHLQFHPGNFRIRVYQCAHCTWNTNQMSAVEDHLFNEHPDASFKFEVSQESIEHMQHLRQTCVLCYWMSATPEDLWGHVEKNHDSNYPEALLPGLEPDMPEAPDDMLDPIYGEANISDMDNDFFTPTTGIAGMTISRFHCEFCDFSTNDQSQLDNHAISCHPDTASLNEEPPIICDSPSLEDYSSNRKRMRVKDVWRQCPLCPFRSNRNDNYSKHMDIHEKYKDISKGYQCAYCQMASPRKPNIIFHLKKYHSDKPITMMNLEDGMKETYDYDRLIVDENGKRSSRSESPSVASSGSSGGDQSARNGTLNVPDEMVFRDAVKCPYCTYSTKVKHNLLRHMRTHSEAGGDGVANNSMDNGSEQVNPCA